MKISVQSRFGEWALLFLLAFSVLWRGGKSLEATWLLAGFTSFLTLSYWFIRGGRRRDHTKALEYKNAPVASSSDVPFHLWIIGILFVLWTMLSFAFSTTRNYGLDEVLRATSFLLIFFWIARKTADESDPVLLRWFPKVMTAAVILAAVIGIAVYIFQPVNRFVGTFFDYRFHTDYWPNAWGQFVLLAWPMVLLEAITHRNSWKGWLLYAGLGITLGSLFLSYSRGSLLAFAGQIIILLFLFGAIVLRDVRYKRVLKQVLRTSLLGILSVILATLLVFLSINLTRSLFFDVQSVTEKVTFTAAEGTSSINERSSFWEQASTLTSQRPLFGWGPYSFRFVQPHLMTHVLATSDHAHNAFLKLAMERGIPAAIFFAAIIFSVIGRACFFLFFSRRVVTRNRDAIHIVLLASVIGALLHNMIDYNLQFVGIGLAFWVSLGFLVIPVAHTNSSTTSFHAWMLVRRLSRIDILIAVILLFVSVWEGYFLVTSSIGRHAQAAGDDTRALMWYERSQGSLFPRDLHLSQAEIYMRLQEYDNAQDALARYERLNAQDPRLWKLKGILAVRMEDLTAAKEAITKAYDYGKYTDMGMLGLMLDIAKRSNDSQLLFGRKLEYDELFSAYAVAIHNNAHFIALSHNVEELLSVSRQLAAAFPSDAQRYKTIARKAAAHARKERTVYESRALGILW